MSCSHQPDAADGGICSTPGGRADRHLTAAGPRYTFVDHLETTRETASQKVKPLLDLAYAVAVVGRALEALDHHTSRPFCAAREGEIASDNDSKLSPIRPEMVCA